MPTVLARTPYGVTVQQDDGTVVTLPPEAAPSAPAPDQGPVPDNAFAGLTAPAPQIVDPNPGDGPVPEGAINADMMGAPPTAPPTAPVSLAPTEADAQLAGAAAPDAISGGQAPLPSDALADPFPAPPAAAAAPGGPAQLQEQPLDPFEAEAQANEQIGALQSEAGRRAAQVQADTEKNIADLQRERERIGAELAQQRADAAQALTLAAQAQAKFAAKDPKQSLGDKVVTSIAVLLGAVGVALSRGQLTTNPVFEVMHRQAEEAAQRRTEQWLKYKDTTESAAKAYDRIDKLTTSQDAYYATTIAAEKEQQALEIERQARLIGTQIALENGAIAAAKVRQEAMKFYSEAADKEMTQRRLAAKDVVDEQMRLREIAISAKNAATSAWNASTGAKAQKETARHNLVEEGLASQRIAADQAKAAKEMPLGIDAASARLIKDAEIRKQATSGPLIRTAKTTVNPDGSRSVVVESAPLMNAPDVVRDMLGRPELDDNGNVKVAAQEWHAPTPEVADLIRKKYAGTHELTTLMDQMTTLIEEHGHEPDFLKSPAWQQATQAMGQAVVKYKGPELGALGVIAGPDEKLIHAAIGTSDPTQFRDTTAGLRQARENMVMSLNTTLHDEGRYTGSPIDFPDVTKLPGGIASPEAKGIRAASGAIPTNDALDKGNIEGTAGPAFNNKLFGVVQAAGQPNPEGRQQALEGLRQLAGTNPDAVTPIASFALAVGVDTAAISPEVDAKAREITQAIDAGEATLDGLNAILLGSAPGLTSEPTIQGAMNYATTYQGARQRRQDATRAAVDKLMAGEQAPGGR